MEIFFPAYEFEWRLVNGQRLIRDPLRKRFVAITPEEWVRQHVLRYMMETCSYPASRIAVEKKLLLNGMTRRADAVVYDAEVQPWLILECKAPECKLNQEVLDQAARYNSMLRAPYLAICNGQSLWLAQVERQSGRSQALQKWPQWPEKPVW